MCVCLCVDPWLWSLNVCVCVCVWKNVWWSYHCKEYAGFLAEKKNLSVFGFWPAILKKIVCSKFCSTAWGTVTRIEPGTDCKKNFTCIGRRHLIDVVQKKKGSVCLRCESNGRTIETVLLDHGQAPFCMVGDRTGLFSREGWILPFRIRFFFLIGAPAAL